MNDQNRRVAVAALLAAVLGGASTPRGPAVAQEPPGSTAMAEPAKAHPKDLKFKEQEFRFPRSERVVLSNGMVLHLVEDHSLPLVDASMVFRGGTAFDPPGKEGLAAITCGMVRTGGTKTLPPDRLDGELDMIAGSVSLIAGQEELGAAFSFMSKDLERGLQIFADVLRNPGFDAPRFQQVKMASAQGILRQMQNPGGVLSRAFNSLTHPGHPYGSLATTASLASLTVEDLQGFHAKWFHPDTCILAVAGDFRRDALVASLEKVLAGWEKSAGDLPKFPAPFERKYPGGHYVVAMPKVTQTNIRMGHWGPPQNTVDRVHFDIMNLVLGGGSFWSRMTKVVRTKEGLAYSVGSTLTRASQGGLFLAAVETKASSSYRAVSLMRRLMAEIRDTPVSEEELSLAKESILNGFVSVIESPASLARLYAQNEYREYPEGWLDKYRAIVRATTVEDVQRIAKEYLKPEALTLVLVGDPLLFDAAPEEFGKAETIAPR